MKLSMVVLMAIGEVPLTAISGALLRPLIADPLSKLVVVMIFTPAIMNGVQFWLVDNIFIHNKAASVANRETIAEPFVDKDHEMQCQS